MAADHKTGADNVHLHAFTDLDRAPSIAPYVAALEAFDALPQLQELKALAREHAGLRAGSKVLDVGCGFGLESFRLTRLVQPGGRVVGIDKSADFIKEAEARAAHAKLQINFEVGDAESPAVRRCRVRRHQGRAPARLRAGPEARGSKRCGG
jgi:cyclopropane fatty-acyl-phospholipid synthase-like methyltransferase